MPEHLETWQVLYANLAPPLIAFLMKVGFLVIAIYLVERVVFALLKAVGLDIKKVVDVIENSQNPWVSYATLALVVVFLGVLLHGLVS